MFAVHKFKSLQLLLLFRHSGDLKVSGDFRTQDLKISKMISLKALEGDVGR